MNPSSDWWSKQGSEAEMKWCQRIHDLLAPQHIDNVFFPGIQTWSMTGMPMVSQGQEKGRKGTSSSDFEGNHLGTL